MRMQRLAAAAALTLVSQPALAGGDGGFSTVIWHAINLAILIGLVVYFAKKPVQRAMKARAAAITKAIDEAQALHAEAKAMLDEYEAKIAALDTEAAAILAQYRAQGEGEKAKLIAEGEAEAARLKSEAERTVANEVARAKQGLEVEVIDRAVSAAEQTIREQLTPADHRRLTSEYLSGLEEAASA